jgi:hypothetical protein
LQLGGLEVGDTAAWAARGGEAEAEELESVAEVPEEAERVGWPWDDPSIPEEDKEYYANGCRFPWDDEYEGKAL